ncbi:hypothetical protein KAR48_11350 [bacterium]|nr:hypothetical protein [bacterium]
MKTLSIDPKKYRLSAHVVLHQIDENHLALVMERRSRIIMADGQKIMEKIDTIRSQRPGLKVSLMTSTPLCSKTVRFLEEEGIEIFPL